MSEVSSLPPWMFNLEGTFLGFVGTDTTQAKFINLEVDGEVLVIKLRKQLRESLRAYVRPGDPLSCIGRSQLKAGTIQLKAYEVFMQAPNRCQTPRPCANVPLTIQVCRKSGCQKRGGRELVALLKEELQSRNLNAQVTIEYTGCQKRCSQAPNFTVGKDRYSRVKLSRLPEMLDRHFAPTPPSGGEPC